jgi:MazG family protein
MAESTSARATPLPQSVAGEEFQKLVDIMARLRGPGGCAWDREQTLESLRAFVLEETYEVLDAIDRADHAALSGEIGDFILEGVFLAQVETDSGRFTVADSLRHITDKLIRRHPHIFGGVSGVDTPGKVKEQWAEIKALEQKSAGEKKTLLKGVAKAMPALLRAHEIGTRVASVGFDWERADDVMSKIEEEVAELRSATREGRERTEEEMGDLLFVLANLARKMGIDAESALRKANEKFTKRFRSLEEVFEQRGQSLQQATLEEMEEVWEQVKRMPSGPG